MTEESIKIFYNNSKSSYPSMMPITPTFMFSNNNPTVNSLIIVWVIIQILHFFFFSFCIMTIIAYITRLKMVGEMKRNQGINAADKKIEM